MNKKPEIQALALKVKKLVNKAQLLENTINDRESYIYKPYIKYRDELLSSCGYIGVNIKMSEYALTDLEGKLFLKKAYDYTIEAGYWTTLINSIFEEYIRKGSTSMFSYGKERGICIDIVKIIKEIIPEIKALYTT